MTVQRENLEGLQLVHTGLVCRDIDAAKARLSEALNVCWGGVEREDWSLIGVLRPWLWHECGGSRPVRQ